MGTRLFTPESAAETAMQLEPLAARLQNSYRRLAAAAPQAIAEQTVCGEHLSELLRFYDSLGELAAAGVVLCDPERRWFELPARLRGRTVRLCWRQGEPRQIGWRDPQQREPLWPVVGQTGWEENGPERVG